MRRSLLAAMCFTTATALVAVACGGDDDDASAPPAADAATAGSVAADTTAAGGGSGAPVDSTAPAPAPAPATFPVDADAAACAEGKTLTDGQLTIATGEPAFPPYVLDDAPESGQGFEAAVAYAVASTMGFAPDQVQWTRTTFEGAIQPGPKDFDFNLQQYGISPDREQAVAFSAPYYVGNQAILGYADSPAATATTLDALRELKIGVASGTTSLTFVTDVIQPSSDPFVFNDNAAAKQALDTKQIDAIVADLPTALFMTAVEIEGTTVFGQFPPTVGSEGESWGLLFAKDNPLVECADLALSAIEASGALEEITTLWMSTAADIPAISIE